MDTLSLSICDIIKRLVNVKHGTRTYIQHRLQIQTNRLNTHRIGERETDKNQINQPSIFIWQSQLLSKKRQNLPICKTKNCYIGSWAQIESISKRQSEWKETDGRNNKRRPFCTAIDFAKKPENQPSANLALCVCVCVWVPVHHTKYWTRNLFLFFAEFLRVLKAFLNRNVIIIVIWLIRTDTALSRMSRLYPKCIWIGALQWATRESSSKIHRHQRVREPFAARYVGNSLRTKYNYWVFCTVFRSNDPFPLCIETAETERQQQQQRQQQKVATYSKIFSENEKPEQYTARFASFSLSVYRVSPLYVCLTVLRWSILYSHVTYGSIKLTTQLLSIKQPSFGRMTEQRQQRHQHHEQQQQQQQQTTTKQYIFWCGRGRLTAVAVMWWWKPCYVELTELNKSKLKPTEARNQWTRE